MTGHLYAPVAAQLHAQNGNKMALRTQNVKTKRSFDTGLHKFFSEICEPCLRRQKGDLNQVPYWGRTILEWPLNLSVICHFLLVACKLIHIFVRSEKCSNYAQNIRHRRKKFRRPADHVPEICAPLVWQSCNRFLTQNNTDVNKQICFSGC